MHDHARVPAVNGRLGILSGPVLPAILCLALGAAVYEQFTLPPDQPVGSELTAPVAGAAEFAATDPFVLPPLAAFSEIVERPVFSPTRRLPSDVEPEAEILDVTPTPAGSLDLVVVGIITGPRELALLRSASGGRLRPMAEGDELSGWTLVEIEPFRLVFQREDDEQMFEIEYRED